MAEFYAHTLEDEGPAGWQTIEEHLGEVARLARSHASAFASGDWGELAGRWHDLGKYATDFQDYLHKSSGDRSILDASVVDQKPGRVDHSTAGAALVLDRWADKLINDELPAASLALAMVIAGHHAGLPDRVGFEANRLRIEEKQARLNRARENAPVELTGLDLPKPPPFLDPAIFQQIRDKDERKRQHLLRHEFWTRMLFSSLIDADRLDTEAFTDRAGKKAKARARVRGGSKLLAGLRRRLNAHLAEKVHTAGERLAAMGDETRERARVVLDLRAEVLAACRERAKLPPGRFSLTVPTGGGKTLAALAFALDHAIKHNLRRVIVVIPFTSIIDQTARAYREALGKFAVVEHHSNLDPATETYHNRLASENWDAPVVVTTSVQYFESLFTRRGTAARKLHNIARSVVVFDEVQTLPHHLRAPIFDSIGQLTDHYGTSVLLCTATQPALGFAGLARETVPALDGVREVMPDVPALFARVAGRVRVDFFNETKPTTWEELAADIRNNRQALVIVHRRDDARDLCRLLGPDAIHLSTFMCAAHRREVLNRIVDDLRPENDRPCLVVSTTLVEAGVDLDFPVVYRALGGADAMAQAAGRCNREGKLLFGRLILFHAPSDPPKGLQLGLVKTQSLLVQDGALDLFHPETFERYFRSYLLDANREAGAEVTAARLVKNFVEVAHKFQMIEENGAVDVVVPFGDAPARIAAYRADPDRRALRALQPFVVGVPTHSVLASRKEQVFESIHDQIFWLPPERAGQYDTRFGLAVDTIAPRDVEGLIVGEV